MLDTIRRAFLMYRIRERMPKGWTSYEDEKWYKWLEEREWKTGDREGKGTCFPYWKREGDEVLYSTSRAVGVQSKKEMEEEE
jgi:hypothetical protein